MKEKEPGKKVGLGTAVVVVVLELIVVFLVIAFFVLRKDYYFSPGGPRPHVVIFLVDALRADHLGCYGSPVPTSPFIDKLAEKGVLFELCRSQAPQTKPSVASIFTSTYGSTHKLITFSSPPGTAENPNITSRDLLPTQMITMAELMSEHGYHTAAFIANRWPDPLFGYHQGFDDYHMLATEFPPLPDGSPRVLLNPPAGHLNRRLKNYLLEYHASKWIGRLEKLRIFKRPLFIYLHYMDVHGPYTPPAPFTEMFDPYYAARPDRELDERERESLGYLYLGVDRLNHYLSRYDAQIRYFDSEMEKLMAWAEEKGMLSPGFMILTADHGEAFGAHGFFHHGNTMYEEELHVPLIFWDGPATGPGLRVPGPVQLIDIAPTLLDFIGAEPPDQFEGISLLGAVRGEPLPDRDIWSENYITKRPQIVRIRGNHKWFFEQETEELIEYYDLESDPGEKTNLIQAIPRKERNQKARSISEWRREKADKLAIDDKEPRNLMTEDIRRQLEALGYLGGKSK
jgi:arylsulfatase A-like enzyme